MNNVDKAKSELERDTDEQRTINGKLYNVQFCVAAITDRRIKYI